MNKKVNINPKKGELNNWVEKRQLKVEPQKTKKYTVELPDELHTRFKQEVAAQHTNMRDVVIELIQGWCDAVKKSG